MTITKHDIRRIAGSLGVLGTELEEKGVQAFAVTLGWEQGPQPAPKEAPDELCVCGHTAAAHAHSQGPCAWVHDDPEDLAARPCWCPAFLPVPADPATTDRRGELREGARAALRHAELKGLLRVLDAVVQRTFRILDAACPPSMDEVRNRRTGEFDPETALDVLASGHCPNCWMATGEFIPITTDGKGVPYYKDRCFSCGRFRFEEGVDKPLEVVRAHSEGRRLKPAELDSLIAKAKAAAGPAKGKKRKGKKGRRAA